MTIRAPMMPKQTFSSAQFSTLSHTRTAREWGVKRRKKKPTWRQKKQNKQVSAPNLPYISALLKVSSLKSSGSGSRTCKLLERVSHFSQRACSTVYPASPSHPLSLIPLTLPVFHARQWELVSPMSFFSPHQLSITINWVFRARGGDSLDSGGITTPDYFHLPPPSEVHPPAVDGGREVLHLQHQWRVDK